MPRIEPQDVSLIPATPADLPVLLEYMKGLRTDDPMPAATLASDGTFAEYYDREVVWPKQSLARFEQLRPLIEAYKASARGVA